MQEIPAQWRERLRAYLREQTGPDRATLSASDFKHNVLLRFPDGSFAFFLFAFYLLDESESEIAVFTEHCGYHFFPASDLKAELFQNIWTDSD
jgi:hypothetical protein